MNFYIVTEGKVEAIVYKLWIPLVNPNLSQISHITEIKEDQFYIISARGYPYYFEVIDNAIKDINGVRKFDRLVICVDSEDATKEEKYEEVKAFISQRKCSAEIKVIVQHFCFEAWALGNRKIIRPHPTAKKLREYKRLYNVRTNDPELLPPKPDENLNRAQFAEKYLRLALNEKFRNLTALLHIAYFEQLKKRLEETGHIPSFRDFLDAFV